MGFGPTMLALGSARDYTYLGPKPSPLYVSM
jgi:hypothetical protein